MTAVSRRMIRRHFGSYTRALEECNLETCRTGGGGNKVPLEKLLMDWATVAQKLKKVPSMGEYEMLGRYSTRPLVRCFGSWRQVPYGLKQFAESHGLAEQWQAELAFVGGTAEGVSTVRAVPPAVRPLARPQQVPQETAAAPRQWFPALLNRPPYGLPMWPGPLVYAPVNEQAVIFLFGAMAWQLGFVVQRWQTEFPDCEAIRWVSEDRCQLVRAELEYESRNFVKHMHDASKCDLIICWKHNWPECPLEVLELRKLVSAESFARAFARESYAELR